MKKILGYKNQNGCFIETAFANEDTIVTNNCIVTNKKFLAENAGKKILNCGDKEFEYRLLAFQKGLTISELDESDAGQSLTAWQRK